MRYVLHDGLMPLAEMNGTGDVSRPNVFGPVGLVASGAGNEGYSTFDPSGNAAITDMGNSTSGHYYGYYAYQGFTGDSGYTSAATYNFSGQYGGRTDPETGLVLLGFRYYDPGTGRFLTKDPIGFAGGINLYAYAGNNPINTIDPLGLWGFQFGENGPNFGWGNPWFVFKGQDLLHSTAATTDGFIPFADPFRSIYRGPCGELDGWDKFSLAGGAFARDMFLTAATPNLSTWVKNPIMYEIGTKTLPLNDFKLLSHLSAIDRGKAIVDLVGWRAALMPYVGPAYTTTIKTGLTPAASLFLILAVGVTLGLTLSHTFGPTGLVLGFLGGCCMMGWVWWRISRIYWH